MTAFNTRGFTLVDWQLHAVDAWMSRVKLGVARGTFEIVTGGGKTLIALECASRISQRDPELKLAVVVPTGALAHQWRDAILEYTDLEPREVGLLGAGNKASLSDHRVVVAVINTAARELPGQAREVAPLMLIVDECHRAGAPSFSKVLRTRSQYRLGLSATPDREEFAEDGEPLSYDEQVVGQALGEVVFRFSLGDARRAGWLPEYELHHHGVGLTMEERRRYETVTRRVDDASDAVRGLGGDTSRARDLAKRNDELGDAAKAWVRLTAERKDLLYRAEERKRVVGRILQETLGRGQQVRALLFHERVDEAISLHAMLTEAFPDVRIGLEHSRLPDRQRRQALDAFRSGEAPVLVSVRSLVEGIDVPDADVGVSVASTSSVRQRVQSLGRVLRKGSGTSIEAKSARMHLVYVADSVDDLIYAKADWTDLTGADENRYWAWEVGSDAPTAMDGPPRSPLPTEDQVWDSMAVHRPMFPVIWPGVVSGSEYSVSTSGVVHNSFERLVTNPQDVAHMVELVRGRPGGRFRVTPAHRLVLVWPGGSDSDKPMLAGQLVESFRIAEEPSEQQTVDIASLRPGDVYQGPSDRDGGQFKISQRAGGLIERRVPGGREIAVTSGGQDPALEQNGATLLLAWEQLQRPTSKFFVNILGHAWYEEAGARRFLADVSGGFAWPQSQGST